MSSRTDPLYTDSTAGSIFEFELPSREFVLDRTLSRFESVTVEPARTAAYGGEHTWPSIWIHGTERIEAGSLLIDDPDIAACSPVLDTDDERLYRIRWSEQARDRINAVCSEEATLQAASASDGRWTLCVSVPEREQLARLYERYKEHGFAPCITQIRGQNEMV